MDDCFDPPDIPDPPPPQASPLETDPAELARRRARDQKARIGRQQLVVDSGSATGGGNEGMGLRIGG